VARDHVSKQRFLCPDAVAQGHSLREFSELPQIVSAFDERGLEAANELLAA